MILSTPLKANGSPEDVLDTRSKHLGEKSLHEGPQPFWFSWSGPCLLCRFCQQAQCHGLAKHAATLQMVIMSTRLMTGFKNSGKYPHEKSLVVRAWFSKMNFYIMSLTNPLLEIFSNMCQVHIVEGLARFMKPRQLSKSIRVGWAHISPLIKTTSLRVTSIRVGQAHTSPSTKATSLRFTSSKGWHGLWSLDNWRKLHSGSHRWRVGTVY
jgi:hypothetical protein